jgi:membrane-associated protease RseP (regulator of RpoE activity)
MFQTGKLRTQIAWWAAMGMLFFAVVVLAASTLRGELPPQRLENATLIVDGIVREAFKSTRQTTVDYIFLIEVRSARLGPAPELPYEGTVPKEGDAIYVHAFQRTPDAPRIPGPGGYHQLPTERSIITAYLYPHDANTWQFAYPLGFEKKGTATDNDSSPLEPQPPRDGTVPQTNSRPRQIGVFVNPTVVNGQRGLRIESVTRGSPAAQAGLKAGDVILTANEVPTQSLSDLTRQITQSTISLILSVRDARTGQVGDVTVTWP